MSKTISLVQRVQIASPCPVSWQSMSGDDHVRFCGQCKLNVYNLSAMSQEEGEQLILQKEGKLCARIYRRSDGTILTKDCPVGLAALRRRVVGFGVAIAATVLLVVGTAISAITRPRVRDESWYLRLDVNISSYKTVTGTVTRWLNTTPMPRGGWLGGIVLVSPPPTPPAPSSCESSVSEPGG